MKPPERDPLVDKKILYAAKGVFVSLGLDTKKNRFKVKYGNLTVQGYFKIRSIRKAQKAAKNYDKLAQLLEEELKKIPHVERVTLRLKGAKKNNGRWTVTI